MNKTISQFISASFLLGCIVSQFVIGKVIASDLVLNPEHPKIVEAWEVSWAWGMGRYHGLLEISKTMTGELEATLDGIPATISREGENISFRAKVYQEQDFENSPPTTLSFKGQINGADMQGGMFIEDEDAVRYRPRPVKWKGKRLGDIDQQTLTQFSGIWKIEAAGGGWWYPNPIPLLSSARKRFDEFVWYQDPVQRCIGAGVARIFSWHYPIEIVTLSSRLLLLYEAEDMVRRIYFNEDKAPAEWPSSLLGYSIGQLSQHSLFIETTRLEPGFLHSRGLSLSGDNIRIREQFTPSQDGKRLIVILILYAPDDFSMPVSRKVVLRRDTEIEKIKPFGCDPYTFYYDLYEQGLMDKYFKELPDY